VKEWRHASRGPIGRLDLKGKLRLFKGNLLSCGELGENVFSVYGYKSYKQRLADVASHKEEIKPAWFSPKLTKYTDNHLCIAVIQ